MNNLIYTIGYTKSYEKALAEDPNVTKTGKRGPGVLKDYPEGYEGGSVWETYKEALKYCPEGYSVYGVLADWNKDTEPNPKGDGNERSLVVDSKIVKL